MIAGEAPHGQADWGSAELRAGALVVPLTGEVSPAWEKHLEDLIGQLDHDPEGWGSIEITSSYLTVASVRHSGVRDLHRLVQTAVSRTNAAFAPFEEVAVTGHEGIAQSGTIAGSLVLFLFALLAVALQSTAWAVPVRPVIVTIFIAIAPGWAILRLWHLASGWAGLALVVALSVSLAMVVSGLMLYFGAWSPFASLVVLAGVTVAASAISLLTALRSKRSGNTHRRYALVRSRRSEASRLHRHRERIQIESAE